jgi:hypothetical protein
MRVHLRELLNDLPEIARNQPSSSNLKKFHPEKRYAGTRRSPAGLAARISRPCLDQDPASFADGRMK